MSSGDAHPRSLRATLVRVVLLMRWLGWLWLVVLGFVTLATGPDDLRGGLVWGSMALATGGLGLTILAARRRFLSSPAYVVVDGLLTVVLALTGPAAGAGDFISGGYPASWLFIVAFATNMRVAASIGAGASALFAILHVIMGLGATRAYGSIQFLVIAVVVGWGFDSLRRQEQLRVEAETERELARAELNAQTARAARLEERSQIAVRLHDSVLQTLKLIRSSADDSDEVRYLARVQERDLRRTISDYESPLDDGLRARLLDVAADMEDTYRIEIDQVVKDDIEMNDELAALVSAVRDVITLAISDDGAQKADMFTESKDGGTRIDIRTFPTKGSTRVMSTQVETQLAESGGSFSSRAAAGGTREVVLEMSR